jgi:2-hydroxycyclohexanecarboxyl-CoA dehydrogenase
MGRLYSARVRLAGKTALVTGGASGIGAACCRRLAAEGARVAVCDVNVDGAREVGAEIDGDGFAMDVTDLQSVREATSAAESALGPIDLLVNNAGTDQFGFFKDTDEELWQRIVDINLFGVMRATHAVLSGMTERGSGRIVNIASEAGRVGSNGSAAYSAAKGGVIAFTKTIAREGARYGVLCNAIAPGPIDTPLLRRAPAEMGDLGQRVVDVMVGSTVLRRLGSPDEVAAVVAFLCSEDSSYVTGQALGVSGGLAMI